MSHYFKLTWKFFLILLPFCSVAFGADNTSYQNRGHYSEGRRDLPVNGFNVELISVLADYHEPSNGLAKQFHARFYLKEDTSVCLIAREKDNRRFYWLDRVQPEPPWHGGKFNEFVWPTATVIEPMRLKLTDLGVLVRLQSCNNDDSHADPESVAPVVLYQDKLPSHLSGYIFTFKLRSNSKVSLSVKAATDSQMVYEDKTRNQSGVFDVVWPNPPQKAGEYVVELNGYGLHSNEPVYKAFRFFHHPGPL